ncbi:DHA2 family efflux MFS transporter permease subunit [Xenorhabdus doucetiae]|uniref:DHA2 family multidrug resistance protein n=1 Tax=Xenorhabdus doucetiae TaxID=351671 RepID=A0A068QMC2_9GAMM|nr:DHA2 family efflux MFS transporter permease subunit [Xenorhabdus doucetiae]TYP09737.1 DHA2 family multidrug resistance protein [Xenorhabdus doucetiae]CDG16037.1 Multidrug resistance protein B [Xenorhabdus doucetiae]
MAQQPLSGIKLGWLTLALALAAFLQILDLTIANVAISTIAGDLGSSTSQGTWMITSFAVASAISIPLTGWLAKRFGEVRIFLASTILFIVASWLCGIANSLEMLIASRILQGIAAGPIMPLSQSLLLNNFSQSKRNMALALWSMTIVVAPVCGPILGGWISDNYHWGWIFLLNIPFGLVVIAITGILLKGRETETEVRSMNLVGLVLLVAGVGCFQLLLDRGKELDWFNSSEIIILAIIAVVCLTFLIIWELTDKNPIIDLSLFKSRNFTIGTICISLAFSLHIGTLVLQPQLLQIVFGYTATWAGLGMAPLGIMPIILAPIIGRFSSRIDMRYLVMFSFIVFALCFFWRAYTFERSMNFSAAAWPQFIQGVAIACLIMPLNAIILSDIKPDKIASAVSLFNFLRTLATSVGTSITMTLWSQRESVHHVQLTQAVTPYNPIATQAYENMQQLGLSPTQISSKLAHEITHQGLIIAANEIYWLFAFLFLMMVFLIGMANPITTTKEK